MTPKIGVEYLCFFYEYNIYHRIKSNSSLNDIVHNWIQTYKVNKESAYLILMQFFINASGCEGHITSEMQTRMENSEIIYKMTKEFDWQDEKYPIIMTCQAWEKFTKNFCEFLQILVRQCNQNFIIDDKYLMKNLISFLIALSASKANAFTYTATLAAVKIMTALVDILLSSDRSQNMEKIENVLFTIFKFIYLKRFEDTIPEIRAICLKEVNIWIEKFHLAVPDDKYLKFIGSALEDKEVDIKINCLRALKAFYYAEDLIVRPKLEELISKFKTQIVALTQDDDTRVAVPAVELAFKILEYHPKVLTFSDRSDICELVFESDQALARAAGKFLNQYLYSFKMLACFCTNVRRDGALLVDSLIETTLMIKDWRSITDLLLFEEKVENENSLNNEEKSSLIYLMVCTIKQTATGKVPSVGRKSICKVFSEKERTKIREERKELTEHFSQILPLLLNKYSVDFEKVEDLITIPQYFDLNVYNKSNEAKNLDSLLNEVQMIVENTDSYKVLDAAAKTIEFMCIEDREIFTRCDIVRSRLIDAIVKYYVKYHDVYGKMLKDTLEKAWKMNEIKCALSMQRSLNDLFRELIFDKGKISRNSEEFIKIKELAKEFALFFDLNGTENRKAIVAFHKAGVYFAVESPDESKIKSLPNIFFLEILSAFANKLLKEEKRFVLKFLDGHLQAGNVSLKTEDRQSLKSYRKILLKSPFCLTDCKMLLFYFLSVSSILLYYF